MDKPAWLDLAEKSKTHRGLKDEKLRVHIYVYTHIYVYIYRHKHTYIRGLLEKYPTVFFYANT